MDNSKKPNRRDRLDAAETASLNPDSLVGSFFHSDAGRGWQGCVVAEVAPQVYLVELFDWLIGAPDSQKLLSPTDMGGWRFYDTAEWMGNAYEHGVERSWDHERKQAAAVAAPEVSK